MILQCSHICKSFATDVVLDDVSFHINDNEKAAIVGVNGSGKSTLLKIIVGKSGYDSGDIIIKKEATVGYLAQNQEFESGESIIEEMQTAKPEVKILEKKMHELSDRMNSASGDELDSLIRQYDNARHRFEQLDGYSYESDLFSCHNNFVFSCISAFRFHFYIKSICPDFKALYSCACHCRMFAYL